LDGPLGDAVLLELQDADGNTLADDVIEDVAPGDELLFYPNAEGELKLVARKLEVRA
jgi:hypothetical protein